MKRRILCLCMDVTDHDIETAIAEGFDQTETLKRFTAVLMGPCEGKSCALNVLREFARLTGKNIAELRVPTLRPPIRPLPLAVMGAEES
ncbi:MAG TPA: (2Fe-2S)-binding protein [Candidatus Binataceae bacterium]|nr:(2Fe-2S)-binding protein [Candidatus Binataceae bacterium]